MGTDLVNRFTFRLGDPYKDGHNQSEDITLACNYTKDEVLKAYTKSALSCGLTHFKHHAYKPLNNNKTVEMCEEYEDNHIPIEYVEKLITLGVPYTFFGFSGDHNEDDEDFRCDTENFTELFMLMTKVNLPDLKYKTVSEDVIVDGMGYGLFY